MRRRPSCRFASCRTAPALRLAVLAAAMLLYPWDAHAQAVTGRRFIQAGLAAVPGVGLEAGYVRPRNFFTVEGMLYADGSPQFAGGEGTLQVSVGLGGALRPLGFVRVIGNTDYPYDLDVGLRFGPSLFFVTNASREEKNQQFSLFLEPYLRFISRLKSGRVFFVEAGTQRSFFRAGTWFRF